MLGERIRYYRKRKNFTQEQLAQGICSVSYLSKFENGSSASEEIVKLLCERLDISYESSDNTEEVREIKELLDDWYEEIKQKNLDKAREQKKVIEEKIKDIECPAVTLKYDLFRVRFLLELRKLDGAKDLLDHIKNLEEHFTDELQFYYLNFSGLYYFITRDLKESLNDLKKAEEIAEKISLEDKAMAELYYQLAIIHSRQFLTSSSINYTHKALAIFDQDYNLARSADCHVLLGITNRRTKNYEQAEHHYRNALKLIHSTGNIQAKKLVYHNLGYLFSSRGRSENAIEYYKKCLDIDPFYVKTIFLMAREYYILNSLSESQSWIERGKKTLEKVDDQEYTYHLKVLEHHVNNDLSKTYATLLKDKVIPFFKGNMQWNFVVEYTENLADYYFANKQYKDAGIRYRLAIEARKKIN